MTFHLKSDRILLPFILVAGLLASFCPAVAQTSEISMPRPKASAEQRVTPEFRRGINLSRPLEYARRDPARPGAYLWPPFTDPLGKMSDRELQRLADLGFDFVRLPVDTGPFLSASDVQRSELLAQMDALVQRLQSFGLAVLLDLHPAPYESVWKPSDLLADPAGEKFAAYTQLAELFAQRFADQSPRRFALELMNEPQPACQRTHGEDWLVTQVRLYQSLRKVAPHLPLVLTGPCWSSADGLIRIDPTPFDKATLFDMHFYDPHVFTHQSIVWSSAPLRFIAGLSYPATTGSEERTLKLTRDYISWLTARGHDVPGNALQQARPVIHAYYTEEKPSPAYIKARFQMAVDWRREHGIAADRILTGEFGAYAPPPGIEDNGSRLRWLTDVRKTSESNGFGWALWDYGEGFGLLSDAKTRRLDRGAVKALGLAPAPLLP